jgi:hypothetical protein
MSPDKLVRMANQIATFFATQPGEDRADRVAQHLRDYWDPRMRAQIAKLGRRRRERAVAPRARRRGPAGRRGLTWNQYRNQ